MATKAKIIKKTKVSPGSVELTEKEISKIVGALEKESSGGSFSRDFEGVHYEPNNENEELIQKLGVLL